VNGACQYPIRKSTRSAGSRTRRHWPNRHSVGLSPPAFPSEASPVRPIPAQPKPSSRAVF
jgi:hypothetical protein